DVAGLGHEARVQAFGRRADGALPGPGSTKSRHHHTGCHGDRACRFVPFTYRHAKSPEEAEKQEAILLAEKREKVKRIRRNGRSAMVFKWLAERFTALWCAISPPLHE